MSSKYIRTQSKIVTVEQVAVFISGWRAFGESIVFTNGCFDLLHLGHIQYLENASQLGSKLIVGVNTDQSVLKIKGPTRPIINENDRARHLAALQFVDAVVLFNELTPIKLIEVIRPDVLVKGDDYKIEQIVGADFVLQYGGHVRTLAILEGYSTTKLIEKIQMPIEKSTLCERKGLLASGSVLVDYILNIDHWPIENSTSFVQRPPTMAGGGAPFNIVKNLVNMNVHFPLSLLGLVGNDDNGKWLIQECIKSGIDTNRLQIHADSVSTSFTYVMSVTDTKRRTFFHLQGANAHLNENHFNFAQTNARLFYLGPLTQLSALDTLIENEQRTRASIVLESARLSGLETIVDFSSTKNSNYSTIAHKTLPFIDHLIINETEAGMILDQHLTSDNIQRIQQVTKVLLDMGVRKSVTIHFEQGAILMTKDGQIFKHGSLILPPDFIKGTVGAGDAFAAGMIYGIHEDWPFDKMLRLAVCVAAMSLSDETAYRGMKTIDECLSLEKFGYKQI